MPKKLLEGIKVVGFDWVFAGPMTTKIFSDWGAEVIKVEGRSRPDMTRVGRPCKDNIPGFNRAGQFNQYSTGKLSVCLNLGNPKGIQIAKKLADRADIVMENFAGGAMKRMGLGYEELKKTNPDIIMLSSCMMGQTGPRASHPGLGSQLVAISGFTEITGWPDREPVGPDGPYTDWIVPHLNGLMLLGALEYRRRTGKGQYIDMSQFENSVHFMAPLILDYAVNKRLATRMGNRCAYAAPHGVYRCRGEDRWCAIAVYTDEEWRSFGQVIGNPAWVSDPKFATLLTRKENEEQLDRLVEEWTSNYSAEDVMNMMQAAGVGAGVVETSEDVLEHDPQLKARHLFWELDHPEIGRYRAVGPSFILSKSPTELRRAPLLSEHNEQVLKGILGMPDEEYNQLCKEGVIE
jgi:benzylsuccinate CoA-transferase BbsF subunit